MGIKDRRRNGFEEAVEFRVIVACGWDGYHFNTGIIAFQRDGLHRVRNVVRG